MPVHLSRSVALALSLLFAAGVPAETDGTTGYQLGRGYALGQTGIRLGGYASIKAGAPRSGSWDFSVNDLSLLTSWEDDSGHWRFFSETEVGDLLSAGEHQGLGAQDAHFELERAYIDRLFDDSFSLRFGKFLTPVGRWNLLHANPLVWTTTRPVATEQLFSKHANGLMAHGGLPVDGRRLDYALYADLTQSLDPYRLENPFENALGGHLLYAVTDHLNLGLSYVNYELNATPKGRYHLVGLEGVWSWRQFEVSSEWVYRTGGGCGLAQGFVQGVAPLGAHWYAVGRYEMFQQERKPTAQLGVFGLAFRPLPPLVWKVEYRLGTQNEAEAPDGLYGSFAVLF